MYSTYSLRKIDTVRARRCYVALARGRDIWLRLRQINSRRRMGEGARLWAEGRGWKRAEKPTERQGVEKSPPPSFPPQRAFPSPPLPARAGCESHGNNVYHVMRAALPVLVNIFVNVCVCVFMWESLCVCWNLYWSFSCFFMLFVQL